MRELFRLGLARRLIDDALSELVQIGRFFLLERCSIITAYAYPLRSVDVVNIDRERTWEAGASTALLAVFFLSLPAATSNGVPYLLDRPVSHFILDFALLAAAFGLAVSAVRGGDPLRRLLGVGCMIVSSVVLLGWLYLLLNWRARWWG